MMVRPHDLAIHLVRRTPWIVRTSGGVFGAPVCAVRQPKVTETKNADLNAICIARIAEYSFQVFAYFPVDPQPGGRRSHSREVAAARPFGAGYRRSS